MVESHPPRAQVGLGRLGTAWPSLPRPYWSRSWGCEIQQLVETYSEVSSSSCPWLARGG